MNQSLIWLISRADGGLWPCLPRKISTYGVRRFHISRSVWDRVCFPSDNDARPGRHLRSSCRRSLLAIPKCVDTYPFLLGFEKCTARDDEILFARWRDSIWLAISPPFSTSLRHCRSYDLYRVISTLSRADHSAYIRYVIMLSNSLFDR